MSKFPNEQEYKKALEVKEKYEKRQKELQWVKNELSRELQQFDQVKFEVDKDRGIVVFSGIAQTGKLKMAIAKCSVFDVFDKDIGKLIAVRRALKKDIDDVVKLVEDETPTRITSGTISTDGLSFI